jgi:hypothetical protein
MEKDIFSNSFEDAYNNFQSSELSKKLNQKFSPKPYYQKFKRLKSFSFVGAILFSFLSALTAFSFVFIICQSMNLGLYASLALSGLALSALEYSKRLVLEPAVLDFLKFRKFRLVLVALFVALSTISIYSSFQGSKLAVNELNTQIALIDEDSVKNAYTDKLGAIDAKIQDYQTNKKYQNSSGVVLYKVSTDIIPKLEANRIRVDKEFSVSVKEVAAENEKRRTTHQANNARKGVNLGYVTILCELLLILCLGYSNYYDYRSFVEMVAVESKQLVTPENTVYTASQKVGATDEVIQLATRKIDADILSYQHKIKNKVGKAETAKKRIKELTAKKAEIIGLNNS